MKVTFVLPNLRLYGGIKSSIHMADALQQLGHEVTIVYPRLPGRDGQPWWRPRKTLVQLVRLLQSFISQPNWFKYSGTLKLVPYLAAKFLPAADVLVVTWWADVARFATVDASKGKVVHFVRSYETWGGPSALVEQVYRLDLPRITNSAQLARQMPKSPICTIHNGLDELFDVESLMALENDQETGTEDITIGLLYRLQDWKRMDDAISVLLATQHNNPEVRVIVFGESLRREHKSLLSAISGLEYRHLPAGDALKQTYQQLDIFLFTSDETEAFGNPPLEAMAMNCAVVSTNVGAIPDYSVDGESALHCEPRNTGNMIRLVQRLIDDPELRRKLGCRAQIASRDYRWREQGKKFEAELIKLIDG